MKPIKRLRILFAMGHSGVGGAEANLLEFLRHADRERFEFFVCTFVGRGELAQRAKELGWQAVHLATSDPFGFLNPRLILQLRALLREWQPHIVHIYGLKVEALMAPLARWNRVPLIISAIRSANIHRRWYHQRLNRWTAHYVDYWISNSQRGKEIHVAQTGVDPQRIKLHHQGIDLAKFDRIGNRQAVRSKLGVGERDLLIGTVANLRPMKGHKDIIDSIPFIIRRLPMVRFIFIGRDQMAGEIQRYAQARGVSDRIIFAGMQHDIPRLLSALDLFLLPSHREGISTAILEALAMRLPVIATSVGGLPEIIEDGITGILIKPQQPQEIVQAVIKLAKLPLLRLRLGQAGRLLIEQRFSLEPSIRSLEELYWELWNASLSST